MRNIFSSAICEFGYDHAQQACPLQYIHDELAAAKKRVAKPQKLMDKGPWRVEGDKGDVWLMSDDFTHDVILKISGDFADFGQKLLYANELAARLNASLTGDKNV